MSKEYCDKFGKLSSPTTPQALRIHCQRPGKVDENGNIQYFTEQAHKNACDINNIIQKYDKTGLITHVSRFEAQFGDVTGLEFKAAQDKVLAAKQMFNELPSEIRKRFENKPSKLLSFMDDPSNREEAIKLGLINKNWTEDTDGLGEHVKLGGNVDKDKKAEGPKD